VVLVCSTFGWGSSISSIFFLPPIQKMNIDQLAVQSMLKATGFVSSFATTKHTLPELPYGYHELEPFLTGISKYLPS
jgi:hypothetical protein